MAKQHDFRAQRPVPFSVAKALLSGLVDRVVRRHTPVLVERHRGKEAVLVIDSEDLANALGQEHRFEPEVVIDGEEFAVVLETLGLQGVGTSLDDALDALLDSLREYADDYFRNLEFYRRTPNRANHYLPLVRFLATPVEKQRALLLEDAPVAAVAP